MAGIILGAGVAVVAYHTYKLVKDESKRRSESGIIWEAPRNRRSSSSWESPRLCPPKINPDAVSRRRVARDDENMFLD